MNGFRRSGSIVRRLFGGLKSAAVSPAAARAGGATPAIPRQVSLPSFRYSAFFARITRPHPPFSPPPFKAGAGGRRFFYVDRHQVHHFRRRGAHRWFENPRTVLLVVVFGGAGVVTLYYGNLEAVPYTKRTHFVLLSPTVERQLGESQFEHLKAELKDKMLPPTHPDSIRVRLIAKDIVDALQRGSESMSATGETRSRKAGEVRGLEPATEHLQGLNWEVVLVRNPTTNAMCLPGGKIIVFTGLLDNFRSDAEIATVIGHEVGHAVARHAAEGITKNLWVAVLQLILYQMEMEADYIGLLLLAAAGYDPRVAPMVYEKLGKITGTPSGRERIFSPGPRHGRSSGHIPGRHCRPRGGGLPLI
ncbi:unnamed protein product [Spirodela intermedia]|uniref:Peptidase M48 domain-containing protein n=1 Tax=Spirodela intermedia TaxID=51605 RepID=A0A7I8IG44_SPIIN|nr:unnamed protein product [Spirodela intermedia]CAA6656254.1 unnamed protein product [Spirodela intermedia]